MTYVQSTAPHARHERALAGYNNAHFKKISKYKHGHETCNIIPRRPSGLEGNSVVLKRPTHSLTAYNLFFQYTRSKLIHSTSITDNDAVAAFLSPRKNLILSIFPEMTEQIRRSGCTIRHMEKLHFTI